MLATLLLAGVAALAICCFRAPSGTAGHTPTAVTARAEQNGVQVTVELSGNSIIRATYRPQWRGFHLYSIALPPGGVDGLGIPTRLSVQGGLRAAGTPTSNQPVRQLRLQGLAAPLPVYPDGPITITLPVTRTGSADARILVSYGACSTSTCLVPVKDLAIPIHLG